MINALGWKARIDLRQGLEDTVAWYREHRDDLRRRRRDARLIVLGNYPPDRQQSMRRFAEWLCDALRAPRGSTSSSARRRSCSAPGPLTARPGGGGAATSTSLALFPALLLLGRLRDRLLGRGARYHVADHSNAPWLAVLPADRAVVTCHDVAIAGALGDPDAHSSGVADGASCSSG